MFQFDFERFDSSENQFEYLSMNRDLDDTKYQRFRLFKDKDFLKPIGFGYDPLDPNFPFSNYQSYFGKINTENGDFYVHSVPDLFENLGTKQPYYLDHFNKVFSRFDADKVILEVIDPYTNLVSPGSRGGGGGGPSGDPDDENSKSPITYIINTPSLAWAYYLLIGALLLYALFKGKRRQKVIPVVAENKNTSLEYIKTLSILYQNQKQNSKLVKHIRDGFFHRVKNKYFLDHKDELFTEKLAAKSRVDKDEINNLVHKLNSTHGAEFTDDQLIILHNQLESFYKQAE